MTQKIFAMQRLNFFCCNKKNEPTEYITKTISTELYDLRLYVLTCLFATIKIAKVDSNI